MGDVNKSAIDEAHRIRRHEEVKDRLRQDVHEDIARRAGTPTERERDEVDATAEELRQSTVREVSRTETEIQRGKTLARVGQVVDSLFYVVYALISLEIILEALGARDAAGFKRMLDAVTAPLLAPFRGLMNDPSVGSSELMLSYVIGLVVYMLVHMGIKRWIRIAATRRVEV